jgi:hypothetical protein
MALTVTLASKDLKKSVRSSAVVDVTT